MNNLQKIGGLLAKEGRTIVYGIPQTAETDNVISLSLGDGDDAVRSLRDKRGTMYTTVYASDYSAGYDLLLEVQSEIESAVKSTVAIVFRRIIASEYDERLQKHILKSQYKIIE